MALAYTGYNTASILFSMFSISTDYPNSIAVSTILIIFG
jgi:hypothetical protein